MSKLTISLEVDRRTLTAERPAVWKDETMRCAMIANAVLSAWELQHEANGSREQLAEWLRQLREWHRADKQTRGEKPRCPVQFGKLLTEAAKSVGAKVHSRSITLLLHRLTQTLTHSQEGLPTWMLALLHRTRLPRFTRGLPISADSQNAKLEIVEQDGKKELWLRLRIDRIETPGRVRAESTEDRIRLWAGGKIARYAAPVWRAAETGQTPHVQLKWVEHKRKWFAMLAVDAPDAAPAAVDPDKVAVIYASVRRPLVMRVAGVTRPITGAGYHVAMKRGQLQKQRRSRQHNYRDAMTPNGKGHGRRRAIEAWEGRFARAWRNFVRSNNETWSAQVVKLTTALGVGTVVYIQPTDGRRFLDVAGQIEPNGSGWEWYQLGQMLENKLSRIGVKVQVVKDAQSRRRQVQMSR